jgi:REP element-mobilizing transposase RayT
VQRNKAAIKNKRILKLLKHAISNARRQGLKVIHFALEYDHIHLLIEAENNYILGKGMQSLGVTMAKGINRLKALKGSVYKHRYHFRQITSSRQLKNVMNYIFTNGIKHKTAMKVINPYNSIQAEMKSYLFIKEKIPKDETLIDLLNRATIFYKGLDYA